MQTLIYDPELNCLSLCNSLFFTAGWGEQSACSVILPSSSPYINCADLEQSFITSTGTCIIMASGLATTDSQAVRMDCSILINSIASGSSAQLLPIESFFFFKQEVQGIIIR